MLTATERSIATLEFTLRWKSGCGSHTERFYAKRVNFWRDILPEDILRKLAGMDVGDTIRMSFSGKELFDYDPSKIFQFEDSHFDRKIINGREVSPRFGRFYPAGLLKGLRGVFGATTKPFRYIGKERPNFVVDFNHPLSSSEFELEIRIHDAATKKNEIGGQMVDWMDVITDGPGMQVRWKGTPTDFFSDEPFLRTDEDEDGRFYEKPRFVTHLDDQALNHIRALYGTLLRPGMKVLDLMSSWRSHVPDSLELDSLVGLGLNEEEMRNNPQLTSYVVHDLNENPVLSFDDNSFDAIICTASVEYLTRPLEVFADCARILKPEGISIHAFTNRWFPPKVVRIWTELSDFERMGIVLEYFLRTGHYGSLETHSIRGWPRPADDQYYPRVRTSDPVFAVLGRRI